MAETGWRLLVTEPLDGAGNMALDEAILRARIEGIAPPTLRFFSWDPPTISVGYGQGLDGINVEACRRLGVGLVRRPTGGSAIYHDTLEREVTYSVVAGAGDFEGSGDLLESYRWIGVGLTAGLRRLGVPAEMVVPAKPSDPSALPAFCFARTGSYEVEVGGKKLVGSAQRRQSGAFLQHGSVLLGADVARLRVLFPRGEGDPLAGMTTLEAWLGRRLAFDDVVQALAAGLGETHGLRLAPGGLTPDEEALRERLVRDKYATEVWTLNAQLVTDLSSARA